MNVPPIPPPYSRDDEEETLFNPNNSKEDELVEAFRKMKIVDLPNFEPNKKYIKNTKSTFNHLNFPKSPGNFNFFDKSGNVTIDFFKNDLKIGFPSKQAEVTQKVLKIANFPVEKKVFDDERQFSEEEDNEYGQFVEENEYPEEAADGNMDVYYGENKDDPALKQILSKLENNEEEEEEEEGFEQGEIIDNEQEFFDETRPYVVKFKSIYDEENYCFHDGDDLEYYQY